MTEAVQEQPKVRPTTIVLSGEQPEAVNAFYNERLGITATAKAAESGDVGTATGDDGGDKRPPGDDKPGVAESAQSDDDGKSVDDTDTDDAIKKAGKKNPKIEARFHDLSEKRKAAEEKAAQEAESARKEREARTAAEQERDALKAKYEPPKTDPLGPKPELHQFNNATEYAAALEDWTTEKVERDQTAKRDQEAQAKKQQELADSWKSKQNEARKELTDYDAKIASSEAVVSDAVKEAIIESDAGPKILYHLATEPEYAKKLAGMNERAALKEIGRLEATLTKPTNKIADIAPVEISKAPAPVTPLKGSGAITTDKVDSEGNFHGSYQDYKAWKAKQKAAGKW